MAKRKKQAALPGMEPPSYPEIDAAAENYVGQRDQRIELSASEKEAHDVLLACMSKEGLTAYEYDGKIITVSSTAKCAVKQKKGQGVSEDTEE